MLRLFGGIDRHRTMFEGHRTVFEGHRTNFQGLAIHRTCFHVLGRFHAPGVRWVHRTWTLKHFPILQDYVGTVVPTHWLVFQELTNHRNKLSGIWLFEGFDSHRTVIQGLHIYRTNFQGQTQTTSICTRSSSPVHILVNCEPIDSKLSLLFLVGWVQRPLPYNFGLLGWVQSITMIWSAFLLLWKFFVYQLLQWNVWQHQFLLCGNISSYCTHQEDRFYCENVE